MAIKDEKAVVEIVLKGQQANATIKDMEKSSRALRAHLSRLPADSAEFEAKTRELQKVNGRLNRIRDDIKGTSSVFDELKAKVGTFSVVASGIAVASAAFREFRRETELYRQFDKSAQNLSAITGADGSDLEYYKQRAIEMSLTVKGGATAVLEAFKLIGSAKPELLGVKEDMALVTEQAILLANATGMELPDAATKLTDALNQFGAPAQEAAKYVDALAAASKWGAAEVPQVTEALLEFGAVAKGANVSIYESTGLIELLAEKGIKGAEAGTKLRNILTFLSAADVLPKNAIEQLNKAGVNIDILRNKTIPLADRLKELSKIAGDASAITEIFGLQNQIAGQIIVENLPRLGELTGQMKDSGVAADQAAKNLNTLDSSLTVLGNTWDAFVLKAFKGGIGGAIKGQVDALNVYLAGITALFSSSTDAERLETFKRRVKQMSAETKAYLADRLEEEIKNAIAIGKEDNKWSAEKKAKHAATILYMAQQLNVYREKQKEVNDADIAGEAKKLPIIATLQKEIQALIDARLNATDQKQIEAYNREIKQKQAQLDKLLGQEKKHVDDIEKLHQKLQEDLRILANQNADHELSDREKDIAKIWRQHEEMLKRLNDDKKSSAADYLTLNKNTLNAISDVNEKYYKQAEDEARQHAENQRKLTQDELDNELDAIKAKYAKEIEYNKKHHKDTMALEEAQDKEIQDALLKYLEKNAEPSEKKTYTHPFFGEYTNEADLISKQRALYSSVTNNLEQLAAAEQQRRQNQTDKEIARIDAKADNDLRREKRLLDAKYISQADYDTRVQQIERDAESRKREAQQKQFEFDKKISIARIIISGAEGVAKAIAIGGPAGIVTGIIAGGAALAQIAIVQGQQMPAYADGGYHEPAGYTKGAAVYGSASGKPFIAGEAGTEYIVSNDMLQHGWVARSVARMEAQRTGRTFGGGGYSGNVNGNNSSFGQPNGSSSGGSDRLELLLELLLTKGVVAKLDYDTYVKDLASIDSAKNGSRIG